MPLFCKFFFENQWNSKYSLEIGFGSIFIGWEVWWLSYLNIFRFPKTTEHYFWEVQSEVPLNIFISQYLFWKILETILIFNGETGVLWGVWVRLGAIMAGLYHGQLFILLSLATERWQNYHWMTSYRKKNNIHVWHVSWRKHNHVTCIKQQNIFAYTKYSKQNTPIKENLSIGDFDFLGINI